MTTEWFSEYGFITDPYYLVEPWVTPFDQINWNREDLSDAKTKVDSYIEEILKGYNTSIMIWGPWRSGKSWLARYIQKNLHGKEKIYFIPIIIEEGDPSLDAFFEQFMSKLINSNWIQEIAQKIKKPQIYNSWLEFFEYSDLSKSLYNIYINKEITLSKEWLIGNKLNVSDMGKIEVQSNLDSLYKKMDVLKTIIRKTQLSFNNFILCIDQLESARGRNARLLSDLLRELIASFYDKFSLILILTMDSVTEWYEYGFTQALFDRVRYTVEMKLLQYDYIPDFLKKQHEIHRRSDWGGSSYKPFQRASIQYLAEKMQPDRIYPNFLLFNCGVLARDLVTIKQKTITNKYIDSHLGILQYVFEKKGQLRLEDNIS